MQSSSPPASSGSSAAWSRSTEEIHYASGSKSRRFPHVPHGYRLGSPRGWSVGASRRSDGAHWRYASSDGDDAGRMRRPSRYRRQGKRDGVDRGNARSSSRGCYGSRRSYRWWRTYRCGRRLKAPKAPLWRPLANNRFASPVVRGVPRPAVEIFITSVAIRRQIARSAPQRSRGPVLGCRAVVALDGLHAVCTPESDSGWVGYRLCHQSASRSGASWLC